MAYNKYTQAELVIGSRKLPETVRGLVVDYCAMYTKDPDELGFLTLEEAQKTDLTESQKEVFYYVINENLYRLLSPQSGLRIRLDGSVCVSGTVSSALRKLQEYNLVGSHNIVEYACFFADYNQGRKSKVKFPEPLNSSFHKHLGYFTGTSRGKKASLRKLFEHLGKRGKIYTMPQYAYARVLFKEEPLPKRVFPKPNGFIPFQLYDFIMSS